MKKAGLLRIVSLILVCCLMPIGISACSNSAQQSNSNKTATSKVVFWNLYYNTQNESDKDVAQDQLFINKAIKKFEQANPSISVSIVTPSMDNYYNMLKAACVANNGPDVAMSWAGGPLMDYTKFFIPLDKYFTQADQSQLLGWILCKQGLTENGAIMGVPVGMNAGILTIYYNKDLFKKAGVDTTTLPKTWDEFLAVCAKLKTAGITPFMDGDKEGWNTAWMLGQLWYDLVGFDGILNYRNGNKHFATDPSFKEAFTTWKKIYDMGYTNEDVASLAQADGQAKFLAGEAAMEVGWAYTSKDVVNGLGSNLGWFAVPHISADAPYANTYLGGFAGYSFSVTKFSKVPDQSVQFIKYMVSAETQDWYVSEAQCDFSNNVNSKTPTFGNNGVMTWMWQYMKSGKNKSAIQWDDIVQGDLGTEVYNMSGAMLAGKMSIDNGLKDFDTKYQTITQK